MSLNRIVITGRMVKDVDLRYTQNGKAVGNVTVAVNRPFKNQNGENEADFINTVVWGKQAENLANYMRKGSQVGMDGRIQSRTYENQQGQTVYVTELVADNVQFLESKGNTSEKPNNQQKVDTYNQEVKNLQKEGEQINIQDSDLPF